MTDPSIERTAGPGAERTAGERTRAVHLPRPAPPTQRPLGMAVYRTAAFAFANSQEYEDLLAGTRSGYSYSRLDNPTSDTFAAGVAALEGAGLDCRVHGQAFASGMAAISSTLFALCSAGGRVVAQRALYGGTYSLLHGLLSRFGVQTTFVDPRRPDEVRAALAQGAAVLWAETLANPTMSVADLPVLASLAHEAGALLVVDSTFASPAVCRPLEHGADVVVHSATKYLGGHSDATGGVVVAREELISRIRAVRLDLGGALAPDEAFLLHRGLATLPLRVAAQCAGALHLAEALEAHPAVARVQQPGLPSSPDHDLAGALFDVGRYGAVLTVTPRGGREAGIGLCDHLRLISVATSLGGTHSVAGLVAATTHRQFSPGDLAAADIDPGAVRISVGLEDPEDLVSDVLSSLKCL